MTVPLDRLYNFLDDIVDQDIVIYRWSPHGSKLLKDLTLLKPNTNFYMYTNPVMVCHDQEPLDYFLYSTEDQLECILFKKTINNKRTANVLRERVISQKLYLDYIREITASGLNIYDKYILLHSEKNSGEINNYVKFGAIPTYYFSHALIARDWYRYADIDPQLNKKQVQKDFLIYQRAWSGTREYRLKFSELLVESNLYTNSLSRFAPIDNNIHYREHRFKNCQLKINTTNLENYFLNNSSDSCSSADYQASDYNQTRIEVVLETLFDDQRWHLTEKTFRPIACSQPFILVSTPGSLEYIKSYGFKTFGDYIDESYDKVSDPLERLKKIISIMQSIAKMPLNKKNELINHLQDIAVFNKKLFFSEQFHKKIVDEYLCNLKNSLQQVDAYKGKCVNRWEYLKSVDVLENIITSDEYKKLLKKI